MRRQQEYKDQAGSDRSGGDVLKVITKSSESHHLKVGQRVAEMPIVTGYFEKRDDIRKNRLETGTGI